jgi:hypothetical protein
VSKFIEFAHFVNTSKHLSTRSDLFGGQMSPVFTIAHTAALQLDICLRQRLGEENLDQTSPGPPGCGVDATG